MIYVSIAQALEKLNINNWSLHGEPTNESEFLQYFHKQVGTDESNGHAIMSNDPEDFGVTWSQIEIAAQQLNDEYVASEYQRLRKPEYPPIGDQLDALWKGGEDAQEMLARVQAVKSKYPKPE
jgi:hypothetical protein